VLKRTGSFYPPFLSMLTGVEPHALNDRTKSGGLAKRIQSEFNLDVGQVGRVLAIRCFKRSSK
jgi:hypothetical protein